MTTSSLAGCSIQTLSDGLRLDFTSSADLTGVSTVDFQAPGEGQEPVCGLLYEYGKPMLPMISRIVAVPANAGLELTVNPGQETIFRANPPQICFDEQLKSSNPTAMSVSAVYPERLAELSEPFVVRGVRFARVTVYPVRYDRELQAYRHNPQIQASIRFTNERPVNRGRDLAGRRLTADFAAFIRAVAVNGDGYLRDNGVDEESLNPTGYYLVVVNDTLLPFVAPFIEWRRKAGYRMDILSLPDNIARGSAANIKTLVQARYDACLDQGVEPFDQILLVGDRANYTWPPVAGAQLSAEIGESVWRDPPHADYKYACLEGNDNYLDAGVSRFCGGYESQLAFMVGKTLAYEATPYMDDTRWFTRGAVYSQHWGNSPEGAWHPTIHTNLRWATEMLKFQNYDDVRFYENYQYDQDGRLVAPFEQDQFNRGVNLMLGRAENLVWAQSLNGINDNVVFPLRLCLSGHGEYTTWQLMRNGVGDHLKGPVVATCGWGGPPTISTNSMWMSMISGMIQQDLSYGWSRVYATTISENYFPNFEVADVPVYGHIRTDNDFYGDPGLRHWRGVPTIAATRPPAQISSFSNSLELQVITPGRNTPVGGALVTLYAPGEMPAFNDRQYASYDGYELFTARTDAQGMARFVFDPEHVFQGSVVYVTITGREIRPYFSQIPIRDANLELQVESYHLTEFHGDGNDAVNPGESFEMSLVTANIGTQTTATNVLATVRSLSPHIIIPEENQVSFGNITPGESVEAQTTVTFVVNSSCPDALISGSAPQLAVELISVESEWLSVVEVDVEAPRFEVVSVQEDAVTLDGQPHNIAFMLKNAGRQSATGLTLHLSSQTYGLEVANSEVEIEALGAGAQTEVNGFSVTSQAQAIAGAEISLMIDCVTAQGAVSQAEFTVIAGEAATNTPLGPDRYGYICYDNTDQAWDQAPDYDWIEICPAENDRDFDGALCEFEGALLFDIGETQVVELGFQTQFYGRLYDRITISTNGYIAMGDQESINNFQNWPLDRGIGGGVGMIAPFWDWLRFQQDNSEVCYYHDEETGVFIVEWFKMRHHDNGERDLNFQVVLFDRDRYLTDSGDQPIQFNYQTIENIQGAYAERVDMPFASAGISSPDGLSGLSYTFYGEYPPAAAPLANQRSLRFEVGGLPLPPADFNLTFPEDGYVSPTIDVEFQWEAAVDPNPRAVVHYRLSITAQGQTAEYDADSPRLMLNFFAQGYNIDWLKANDATWHVTAISGRDTVRSTGERRFRLSQDAGSPMSDEGVPKEFGLQTIAPNPFNSTTTVSFLLTESGLAQVKVFDIRGREMATLFEENATAGSYTVKWDATGVSTGVYLLRLTSGSEVSVKKAALVG